MAAQPAGMKSSGSRRNVSFGKLRNWQINLPTTFKAKTIEWPEGDGVFNYSRMGGGSSIRMPFAAKIHARRSCGDSSRRCFMADRIEVQIDEILATCEGDLLGAL